MIVEEPRTVVTLARPQANNCMYQPKSRVGLNEKQIDLASSLLCYVVVTVGFFGMHGSALSTQESSLGVSALGRVSSEFRITG